MSQNYKLVAEMGPTLVVLESREFPPKMWTECTVRKYHRCVACNGNIKKGRRAYRPITNGNNRMDRICIACITLIRNRNRR